LSGFPVSEHPLLQQLPPRERQVAEIVFERGQVTAAEVRAALTPAASNSAVRMMLFRLEQKKVVRRVWRGRHFFYASAAAELAGRSALQRVLSDYFGNRPEDAIELLLSMREAAPAQCRGTALADHAPEAELEPSEG